MPVLETVALNLTAAGLATGGSQSVEKVRGLLRDRRFSDDIEDLETEFNVQLRDGFIQALADTDRLTEAEVKRNWDSIAAELNEINVIFETEEKAITQITAAIATGLGYKLEADPELHEEISSAVARVYRDVLQAFETKISGTELADQLSHRADIELTSAVNDVAEQLEEIERQQRRQQDAKLREQGFVSLSSLYFERQTPESPTRCWRTGFELVEVNAGYTVEREKQQDDSTRVRLTDLLYNQLRDGADCVILGPPGSGKSTICKQVACRWYDEGGSVFYRSSDHARPLSDWGSLVECIRQTNDHVLVAVEDAIRDEAVDIFHVIDEFRHDSNVTFLLDSREGEWHGSNTKLTDARLQEIKDSELHHTTIPQLDVHECERIVNHFETTTNTTVADLPSELFDYVRTTTGVGEILQLSYHLSFYAADATDASPHSEGITSLETSIQSVIDQQQDDDEALSLQLGVLINLLNAADIGAHPELLQSLAESRTDHETIDTLLKRYDGTLVFANQNQTITDQIEPLRTNHEFWSTLYLQELLDLVGKREATRLFETCLNRLFTLIEDREHQTEINRWFRTEMPFFTDLNDTPTATADAFVERIFDLGRRQPALAPLYGTTQFTVVDAPSICSPDIPVRMALWRGIMYFHAGNLEAAETEFQAAKELLHDQTDLTAETTNDIEGWCLNYLGAIDRKRGDLDTARKRHRKSERQFKSIDDPLGVAFSLYNIGKLYRVKSELDIAQRHLEDALDAFQGTGERHYVSTTLNTLGLVLRDKGEFDEAEQRLQQSRENAREAGDERSEARSLNHLGEVKKYQGELNAADEYYRRALKLARKVGDTQCEEWLVHNLGDLAYKQGELEQAFEYFTRSKELSRNIGNQRGIAISLNYVAEIKCSQGKYDAAADHVADGLDIIQEVGDRRREAELLKTRGIIARNRGRFDRAHDSLEQSLGIFEEVGDQMWKSDALIELGTIALKQHAFDRAEDLLTDALTIKRDINDREGEVRALGGLGQLAQHRDNLTTAATRYQTSHDIAVETGDKEDEAYSLSLLGELARERGNFDQSQTLLSESRSLFVEIGEQRRLAKLDRQQGLTALARDDYSTANDRLTAALTRSEEIGDEMGCAKTLAARGHVAHANGNSTKATSDLEEAIDRFRSIGATDIALNHVEALVDARASSVSAGSEFHSLVHDLRQEVIGESN